MLKRRCFASVLVCGSVAELINVATERGAALRTRIRSADLFSSVLSVLLFFCFLVFVFQYSSLCVSAVAPVLTTDGGREPRQSTSCNFFCRPLRTIIIIIIILYFLSFCLSFKREVCDRNFATFKKYSFPSCFIKTSLSLSNVGIPACTLTLRSYFQRYGKIGFSTYHAWICYRSAARWCKH
uniref:Uncharacterized protein n=1 Tax=Ixodes ricinus TaxID=34613 RepID=A0A6B0UZZ2_IXORI